MTLNWTEDLDDNNNTVWEADSPYHDEGSHFKFRIRQELQDNQHRFVDDSDYEVTGGDGDWWPTVGQAKAAMEKMADTILNECRNAE